ncbi:hypothetical protein ACNKHX_06455 [Shigella flexneri]
MYTIIPEVTLPQSCLCRVPNIVPARRRIRAKSDEARKTLSLPANQPIALTKLVKIFANRVNGFYCF